MLNHEAFTDIATEATTWRRWLHQHPELDYRVHETARFVAEKLATLGIDDIHTGIAETGIVALIRGRRGDGPTIGLRADMDALPIEEQTNRPWVSKTPGQMHACGHDGHMAMLLGAAKHLAASRDFSGTVALIFQPAEEGALGGLRMVEAGIMERFGISQVFGMHNMPGIDVGRFGICAGPIMAAIDEFDIVVTGRGGHAAMPHQNIDPIRIAAQIVTALQTLVSRNTDPSSGGLVVSVTKFHAGDAYNITPERVALAGTVRTLTPALRDFAEQSIAACAKGIAATFGASVEFAYRRHDPVTFNAAAETDLAIRAARKLVGDAAVDDKIKPLMISEDFAYMLQARPGAFIFLGNGPSASLHHPAYDFDDAAMAYGVGYWVSLVEAALSGPSLDNTLA
jgi:amidohydrolase